MKIKLILGRTDYDPVTAWTAIKTVEVNIPMVSQNGWQVIGADWEYDKEYEKMQNERIEQSRLIQTLEDEIDLLTKRNDPEQQKIANRQYMSKQLINEVGEVVAQGEVGIDLSTQNDFTGKVKCGTFHEKCLNDMEGT